MPHEWRGEHRAGERDALLEALTALYDVLRVDAFDAEGIRELAESSRGKRRVVERQSRADVPEAPGPQLAAVKWGRDPANADGEQVNEREDPAA